VELKRLLKVTKNVTSKRNRKKLCNLTLFRTLFAFAEFLIGTVPLTLCGISYERLRSLPRVHEVRSVFPTWKVLLFTWGVSALLSSPRFLAYEYHTRSYNGNGSINITSDTPSMSHSLRSNSNNDYNDSYTAVGHKSVCRKVSNLTYIDIDFD